MNFWIGKRKKWLRPARVTIFFCLSLFFLGCTFIKMTNAPKLQTPGVKELLNVEKAADFDQIYIMSLNMAHGRANGSHQMTQSTEQIRANLDDIAKFLSQESPDIVAVQEADEDAFWSGSFNHLEQIANSSRFPFFLNGGHMQGFGLHYGTGFISKIQSTDHLVYTFDSSFPTPSKGFTLYQIQLRNRPIDIISVHLDFAKASTRQHQKDEIVELMKKRGNSMIVIGDINSGWHEENSAVRALCSELNLKTFRPASKQIVTFPKHKSRIDWILISQDLQMHQFRVHQLNLSDHFAVSAKIRLATQPLSK